MGISGLHWCSHRSCCAVPCWSWLCLLVCGDNRASCWWRPVFLGERQARLHQVGCCVGVFHTSRLPLLSGTTEGRHSCNNSLITRFLTCSWFSDMQLVFSDAHLSAVGCDIWHFCYFYVKTLV